MEEPPPAVTDWGEWGELYFWEGGAHLGQKKQNFLREDFLEEEVRWAEKKLMKLAKLMKRELGPSSAFEEEVLELNLRW